MTCNANVSTRADLAKSKRFGLAWPCQSLLIALIAALAGPVAALNLQPPDRPPATLERITVEARRGPIDPLRAPPESTEFDSKTLERVAPQQPAEIVNRAPGARVQQGSGQESLLAVRSPVLTGAGACAAFRITADALPVRATGFCNVNQLFELPLAAAVSLRVDRGPGSGHSASGALHGAIAVATPTGAADEFSVAFRAGSHDNYQETSRWAGGVGKDGRIGLWLARQDAGSFRDQEGYRRDEWAMAWMPQGSSDSVIRASHIGLDQDTAGFVRGFDAYRDERRRRNDNPEAFRCAATDRILWTKSVELEAATVTVLPYARQDRTDFLQHFLPGQPLESNQTTSVGVRLLIEPESAAPSFGIDAERARGGLLEFQRDPVLTGSDAARAIRPVGRHYDFNVDAGWLAAHLEGQHEAGPLGVFRYAANAERLTYDYDNQATTGNLRDDGSACGFGGCLYNRPADRKDSFTGVGAMLGWQRPIGEVLANIRIVRGFRLPQAFELYRLQRGQDIAELDSEIIRGLDGGLRWTKLGSLGVDIEWSLFHYAKDHTVVRNSQGITTGAAASRHAGMELATSFGPDEIETGWFGGLAASYARHQYARDVALAGETLQTGRDIDSAPRKLANAVFGWREPGRFAEVEVDYVGPYFADAEETARYPGHALVHVALGTQIGRSWRLALRVRNVADRRVAERADFAFGNWRYFPAPPREVSLEFSYRR